MMTFLDLLIVVSMALIAAGFLSLLLMFLVKSKKVQKICFYISVALSLYMGYVGFRINWPDFFSQAVVAAAVVLVSLGAVLLERVKKNDDKMFRYARIASAAALVVGTVNALLI